MGNKRIGGRGVGEVEGFCMEIDPAGSITILLGALKP